MKATLYRKDGRFVVYDDVISIHTDYILSFGGVYIKVKHRRKKSRFDWIPQFDIYPSYEIDKIILGGSSNEN